MKKIKDISNTLNPDYLRLEKENKALKETVNKLLRKIDEITDVPVTKIVNRELSPEEEIIDLQIERLRQKSRLQELSLDETRMLDIHIKNKRLIEKKSTINADFKKIGEDLSDDELLELAEGSSNDKE